MAQTCDIDAGTIRRVDWLELVPLTLFFRAFALTFKPTFLILGAALTFASMQLDVDDARFLPLDEKGEVERPKADFNGSQLFVDSGTCAFVPFRRLISVVSDNRPGSERSLIASARRAPGLFAIHAAEFLCALWLALAVARTAVVRLTTTARSSTRASLVFAARRFPSALLAVSAPLCVLAFLGVGTLLVRVGGSALEVLSPVAAVLFMIFETVFFIFTLACPLSLAAIATENCDGFDAISRGASYFAQRAIIWFLYVVAAQILIFVGRLAVGLVCALVYSFYAGGFHTSQSPWVWTWGDLIRCVPGAYSYVAAIVYSCAIYVMLRRSVDGTPFDECALNLKGSAPRKLRRLLKDGKGAPTFDFQKDRDNTNESLKNAEVPATGNANSEENV